MLEDSVSPKKYEGSWADPPSLRDREGRAGLQGLWRWSVVGMVF